MRQIEKFAYLGAIDRHWIDHIDHIDGLREGVRLRGYAQRDPLVEFKNEAYELFEGLIDRIDGELARRLFRIGVSRPQPEIPIEQARANIDTADAMGLAEATADQTAKTGEPAFAGSTRGPLAGTTPKGSTQVRRKKIGRNDPCPCGSGKKWKKCHYPEYG